MLSSLYKSNKLLRLVFIITYLLIGCYINDINGQQDFQFDNDDTQVVFTEATDIVESIQNRYYEKEIQKCSTNDEKIYLTFVLRTKAWKEIDEKNKDIAINKLSYFFNVPKKLISVNDLSTNDINNITKLSTERGINQLKLSKTKLGRLEFIIGCNKLFTNGQLIKKSLPEQMRDNLINVVSGLDFGWWVIWKANSRVKRQIGNNFDGSGEIEDEEEYDYNDEEEITEMPSTPPTHGHRHHHGEIDDLPENIPTERQQMTTEKIVTARQSNNYKFADRTTTDSIHKHKIETTTVDYIEYDDDEYDEGTTIKVPTERSTTPQYILPITTLPPRTTTTEIIQTTTEEYEEPINHAPFIRNRLPKLSFPAGQVKIYYVPIDTFSDVEDGTNLKIELFHENDTTLEANTWIQYNPERRELYALPLEDAVSKWKFRLHATDKGNDKIAENIDAIVQQNKVVRSANHEISIGIKLLERFSYNIDWQMRLINGIVNTLGDYNSSNIVVREIRMSNDRNSATFVYTNISLPRNDDNCPTKQMEDIVKNLDINILTKYVHPSMQINNVAGQLINACKLLIEPTKIVPPHVYQPKSNRYPIVRNPIDRINAIAHQLLIFKVPTDTFFDEDDKVEVTQSLKTINDTDLPEKHWLQFDAKNNEFYGLPKTSDISENQYVLYGTDRGGLKARDVLVVVVSPPIKKDYSVIFEMTLGITYDRFNNSLKQRYFIERIAEIFNDQNTSYIQIRSIRSNHYTGNTVVSFYNTTLYRQQQRCPDDEIELIRNIYVHKDGSIKDKIRNKFGSEYNLLNMTIYPIGTCSGIDTHLNIPDIPIIIQQPKTEAPPAQVKDDYLLTFVLPAVIILAMLLLASIVACVLHRRRLTGKMELGDEEERRSFRSKGIPVIFQDELEEKPEIGNKSPVIMKDEKPPLLPPSYTSTNPDEEEDYGNYVAPPGVTSGGRESRGKSPVTPSYRKPPPYVSP